MNSPHLVVRNWTKFQHYRDRTPPWIKLHYELLTSPDWVMIDDASKLLAVVCMLVASRNEGRVPNNPAYLQKVGQLSQTPSFKALIDCGFLEDVADASTPLADAIPRARSQEAETEAETETNKPTKAPRREKSGTSIAIILEDLAIIPYELRARAGQLPSIDDEWARFRNHHISLRSKHTRLDLCWDTWLRNAAKFSQRSNVSRGNSTRQSGNGSRDIMASAKRAALAELTGQRPEGHGGTASFTSYPTGHNAGIVGQAEAITLGIGPNHKTQPGDNARLVGADSNTVDRA